MQLRLHGVCLIDKPWLMVTSFAPFGNLAAALTTCRARGVEVREVDVRMMADQLAAALQHLADQVRLE